MFRIYRLPILEPFFAVSTTRDASNKLINVGIGCRWFEIVIGGDLC